MSFSVGEGGTGASCPNFVNLPKMLSKFCRLTKNAAGLTELVGKEGDVAIAESPPALRLGRLAPRSCYHDDNDDDNDNDVANNLLLLFASGDLLLTPALVTIKRDKNLPSAGIIFLSSQRLSTLICNRVFKLLRLSYGRALPAM